VPEIALDGSMDEDPMAMPAPEKARRAPPKVVLIAIAAALLLAVAGGAFFWLRGGSASEDAPAAIVTDSTAYVDAPAMVVNMRSADGRTHFLKLRFVIVATSASQTDRITQRMPAIVDGLQSFLRELRPEDLSGSAAVFRVKEEMMIRTRAVLGAGSVSDILIQDLVEQ
jgi:flagellar FliL protein